MQVKVLAAFMVIALALALFAVPANAFSFSDWLKNILRDIGITGNAVSDGSNMTCGNYTDSTPSPDSTRASDSAGSNFNAAKAVDGDVNSRWIGNTTQQYPKWIYFDLGTKKCVNAIDAYVAAQDVNQTPLSIDIQVSDDAQSWQTIVSQWSLSQGGSFQTQSFAETRTRYVRIFERDGAPNTYGTLSEARINTASLISASPSQNSSQSTCTDSGATQNNSLQGFVNQTNSTGSSIFTDTCSSSSVLTKYSCNSLGQAVGNSVNCPNGCQNGACIVQSPQAVQTPQQNSSGFFSGNTGSQSGTTDFQTQTSSSCGSFSLNSPVNALASSEFNNYHALNAIDGDINTHWFGDPTQQYPKWIAFDLGGEKCVNAVDLNIFVWDSPVTLDLQASDDGQNWKTVSSGWTISDGGQYAHKDFSQITTRYIRVYETAGHRNYGTLSEIRVNSAPFNAETQLALRLHTDNVIGGSGVEQYYIINGQKAYVSVDGKPVESYFNK